MLTFLWGVPFLDYSEAPYCTGWGWGGVCEVEMQEMIAKLRFISLEVLVLGSFVLHSFDCTVLVPSSQSVRVCVCVCVCWGEGKYIDIMVKNLQKSWNY